MKAYFTFVFNNKVKSTHFSLRQKSASLNIVTKEYIFIFINIFFLIFSALHFSSTGGNMWTVFLVRTINAKNTIRKFSKQIIIIFVLSQNPTWLGQVLTLSSLVVAAPGLF